MHAVGLASVSQPSISPVPHRRWRIAALLSIGVLVNYFDRVNLSVSQDALHTAFGITPVTFGLLSGAYSWTYALCQLPVGVLLDRFGVKVIGRISALIWSAASFGAAITPGLSGFFGARLLLGVGEAPTFPANGKATGMWFPHTERSFATSLFDAAAKFASALGVPALGLVLLQVGWRWSFALTGIASLLYFALFAAIYRDPDDDPGLTAKERAYIRDGSPAAQQASESASLFYLLRQKKVLGLAIGFGSYNYVFYLLLTWLPSYLSSALHIDLRHSFLYTGVPWLFATVTDLVVGGWLVDTLIRRGWNANRVRTLILVGGTAFGLGILGAVGAHTAVQALLWISISLGGLAAAAPITWSAPSLIAPGSGSIGKVGGIMNFAGQISAISAPMITGYLVETQHGSYTWVFGLAAAYLLIGITAYLLLLGRIEAVPSPSVS